MHVRTVQPFETLAAVFSVTGGKVEAGRGNERGCRFQSLQLPLHPKMCLVQEAIQLDGEIFFALLRRVSPIAYRHLKRYKIDPILYMTEWFMCIFSRTLPWCSVLRVWDMFFCEGETRPSVSMFVPLVSFPSRSTGKAALSETKVSCFRESKFVFSPF